MDKYNYLLRQMVIEDLAQVVQLEQACYPQPWSQELFCAELDNTLSTITVCLWQEQIVGYLCYWDIAQEIEIHNVATSPAFQGRGVGSHLMTALFAYATQQQIDTIFLEVRRGNIAAIRLYEKFVFQITGCRKQYYADGEDGLLMTWQR